jgi:hypothetical protein
MTLDKTSRHILLLLAASLSTAGAQTAARRPTTPCDRITTTTFEFGRTGGSIRPASIRLAADGTVMAASGDTAAPMTRLRTIPKPVVAGLARLAWTGGFATLRPAPTRPTRNPDAARRFIAVRSACGSHRVEYAMGEEAPRFRELYALLEMAADATPQSP